MPGKCKRLTLAAGSKACCWNAAPSSTALSMGRIIKYGTVPIVRATGGLADTVVDATPANLAAGKATGFAFVVFTAQAFFDTVKRAVAMYRDEPGPWLALMRNGMRQDWSWDRSAAEY